MSVLQAIILGIIQGLTEFLPVSSSAHLVIAPYLFNWNLSPTESFIFDVLVQMGTLVAVIFYFWKDLWGILTAVFVGIKSKKPWQTPESRLGWLILLATLPAGLIGMLLKDQIEAAFHSPLTASLFLLGTAVLLIVAERTGQRSRDLAELNWADSLLIGLFQAFAVFPGISRSGSTIAGAMLRNTNRSAAARFSFLMSIPIMLAAGGLATIDLINLPSLNQYWSVIVSGFTVSAVVGYLSIRWLLRFLISHSLYGFAGYCTLLSILVLLLNLINAQ